jgi:hypothetical protein
MTRKRTADDWLMRQRNAALVAVEMINCDVGRCQERVLVQEDNNPDDEVGVGWAHREFGKAVSVLTRCHRAFDALDGALLEYLAFGVHNPEEDPLRNLGNVCVATAHDLRHRTDNATGVVAQISTERLDHALAALNQKDTTP